MLFVSTLTKTKLKNFQCCASMGRSSTWHSQVRIVFSCLDWPALSVESFWARKKKQKKFAYWSKCMFAEFKAIVHQGEQRPHTSSHSMLKNMRKIEISTSCRADCALHRDVIGQTSSDINSCREITSDSTRGEIDREQECKQLELFQLNNII